MEHLAAYYLIGLTIALVAYLAREIFAGREDLVSLRNFFFAGLIIFQLTGPAASIMTGEITHFQPSNLPRTSVIYASWVTVFVFLFIASYKFITGFLDRRFAKRNTGPVSCSPTGLIVIAATSIGVGILSQYVLSYIPVLGPGFFKLAFGLYAIAAGLATWAAAPRLWNPFFLLTASTIIVIASGLTFAQNFGRRDLLGVLLAIMWALYFSHWRSLGIKRSLLRFSVVAVGGLILLGLVTSARSADFRDQSAIQNIQSLRSASAGEGITAVLYGQSAGLNSMWLIESRPESNDYDTLHSLRLMIAFPIPRAIWHQKPDGLGITMPKYEIKVAKKAKEWNVGPGIIGHIANDNPWLALWMYPIIVGVVFRVFDRAAMWYSTNPFVVLPMGAAIGQVVGMPRGEFGSFFFLGLLNIISTFVLLLIIYWVLRQIGWVKRISQDEAEYWYSDSFLDEEHDPNDAESYAYGEYT